MLKLCVPAIAKPLYLIFSRSLSMGIIPSNWKYPNVQPIHKKNDRQIKSNYRPISLLPICGKILENNVFEAIQGIF